MLLPWLSQSGHASWSGQSEMRKNNHERECGSWEDKVLRYPQRELNIRLAHWWDLQHCDRAAVSKTGIQRWYPKVSKGAALPCRQCSLPLLQLPYGTTSCTNSLLRKVPYSPLHCSLYHGGQLFSYMLFLFIKIKFLIWWTLTSLAYSHILKSVYVYTFNMYIYIYTLCICKKSVFIIFYRNKLFYCSQGLYPIIMETTYASLG